MRSPLHRALGLQVGLLVACLVVSTVQARSGEDLEGSVRFAQANLLGETNLVSPDLGALHLVAGDAVPLSGSWSLHASNVIVNWSRVRVTAAGQSPTDPDRPATTAGSPRASAGNAQYSNAFVSSAVEAMGASVLFLPRSSGQVELQASTNYSLAAQPTDGENWSAGLFSNQTTHVGDSRIN